MQKISFERLHFCPFDYVWAYLCCRLSKLFAFLQYFRASYVENQIPLAEKVLHVSQAFERKCQMLCKAKRQKFLTRREIEGGREEEGREQCDQKKIAKCL